MQPTKKQVRACLYTEPLPESLVELTKKPAWEALSSAAQRLLIREHYTPPSFEALTFAPDLPAPPVAPAGSVVSTPAMPGVPVNIRANDPADDALAGNNTTQSEPTIAVSEGFVVVGYNDSNPSQSLSGYARSTNFGQTFADDGGIPAPADGDPVLAVDRAGAFYFASLGSDAQGQSAIIVARSTDHGQTFTAGVNVSGTTNGATNFQDKEWITVDTSGGAHDGNVYVVWTNFTDSFNHAQIFFTRSTDGGVTWAAPQALSALGTGFSHQGAMPAVAPNGDLYVVWINRATSQLLIRRSTDGGATFTNPVTGGAAVQTITQIPGSLNGGFRAPTFPSVAISPTTGTIFVAYPAGGAGNVNVFLTRSLNQGQTWSVPIQVNDDGTTTDQWMPSVAIASNGVVGVMFYDRRNDPSNTNMDIYLALSTNDGVSVLPNKRITATSFPPAIGFDPRINPTYMGDYNQIVASGTRFHLAWGDNRDFVGSRHDPNVYCAVVGTEDCYVRDSPIDDGSTPSTAGQAWQSPDIQPAMNPSVFGVINPVQVQVHNTGPQPASNVTVHLLWTDPATFISASAWQSSRIQVNAVTTNQQVIPLVPAGGTAMLPVAFSWDPPAPSLATDFGHYCLHCRIESAGDPMTFPASSWENIERDNNLAVRNVHVIEGSSAKLAKAGFFIVGGDEEKWRANLIIDGRALDRHVKVGLVLPARLLAHAELRRLEVIKEGNDHVTLAVQPRTQGAIMGISLDPKKRHAAQLFVDFGETRFRECPLRITQAVGRHTVGGLLYLIRHKK